MIMKKLRISICAGALLCGLSLAQDTSTPESGAAPPATQQPQQSQQPRQSQRNPAQPEQPNTTSTQTPRIAPGSVIPVQLTKSIDAKKAKSGDEVEAKVTQDLKTGTGELIVPKDTKVVGHVTEAQARSKEQKESQVGIAFDHAVMKDGHDVALPMSIQAIIAPQALNSSSSDTSAGQQYPTPNAGGGMSTGGGGRQGGMGTGTSTPQTQNAPAPGGSAGESAGSGPRPSITANTQGVVGISDMKLSTAGEAAGGSVVSSEKNNVKLENGTLMLLRVNH